jgi:hypothetical protein
MFRSASGFKAQYHYLRLLVASDFDEWRVIVEAPGVTIIGGRQLGEDKAKQHAVAVADNYIHQEKHEDLPVLAQVAWEPLGSGEWLNWRPDARRA